MVEENISYKNFQITLMETHKTDPGFFAGALIGLMGGVVGNFVVSSLYDLTPKEWKLPLMIVGLIFFTLICAVLWYYFAKSLQQK